MNQKGQAILALILIMTVALAIGVSIIQKSLVDVSTSTKVETSQRAFSAAEAGIEKALRGSDVSGGVTLENQSSAKVQDTGLLPFTASSGSQQEGLEYPPFSKEEFAHGWLADLTSTTNPPGEFYMPASKTTNRGIEIYWGNPSAEKAAIAVKIIYYTLTLGYQSNAYYFDPDATRTTSNGFTNVSTNCLSSGVSPIDTILGTNRSFFCKMIIDGSSSPPFPVSSLMLVRIRLLYNSTSQQVALRGYGTCGRDCSLPPQARIIVSKGTSVETQRTLQVFQVSKVVPPYFDFAIFSAGEIRK